MLLVLTLKRHQAFVAWGTDNQNAIKHSVAWSGFATGFALSLGGVTCILHFF